MIITVWSSSPKEAGIGTSNYYDLK